MIYLFYLFCIASQMVSASDKPTHRHLNLRFSVKQMKSKLDHYLLLSCAYLSVVLPLVSGSSGDLLGASWGPSAWGPPGGLLGTFCKCFLSSRTHSACLLSQPITRYRKAFIFEIARINRFIFRFA